MPRLLAARAVLAVGLVAAAAPTLKEPKEPLYFPTSEGVKRVYEYRAGDTVSELAEVVTKVEKKDGVFRVRVGSDRTGQMQPLNTVEVSDK